LGGIPEVLKKQKIRSQFSDSIQSDIQMTLKNAKMGVNGQ
jgi:hypothetical protein